MFSRKFSKIKQHALGLFAVAMVSASCYVLIDWVNYRIVALLLLLTVSVIAMLFDIVPVLFAALMSALIWNYFFIPPKFTLQIENTEDLLMFFMYFVVAMVNGVLTNRIRQFEKQEQKKEEREHTLKLYNSVLNSLSHELRTPIATIQFAGDNLQNTTLNEGVKQELVLEISKAAERLNRQVENLLNMSRLESGNYQLKIDWCDINELVYQVAQQLKEFSANHQLHISIAENLPLCKLDATLTEHILHNLIQNAITYVPKNGNITIKASYAQKHLFLIVEDDGEGFPEKEIDLVFDKFYRLKRTATGGTGLGLSIVRGFVEAQHGSIHLKNREEGGACFSVSIPCDATYVKDLEHD